MLQGMPLSTDDIVDALDDLQHDLGKYLRLPLAFLPPDASENEVQNAVHRALFETRRAGERVDDASSIWNDFRDEVDGSLDTFETFRILTARVDRALEWSQALGEHARPLDRLQIEADFSAVGQAIRDLRDAFNAG